MKPIALKFQQKSRVHRKPKRVKVMVVSDMHCMSLGEDGKLYEKYHTATEALLEMLKLKEFSVLPLGDLLENTYLAQPIDENEILQCIRKMHKVYKKFHKQRKPE